MAEKIIVGGIEMSIPLILGAGVAKHPLQAKPFFHPNAQLGAVVLGSFTLQERLGNQGNLVWPEDFGRLTQEGFGLNALGMPNIGLAEAIKLLPSNPTRPIIISIAGFKASEYIEMLNMLKGNESIAGVEINGGCPNTGHLPVAYAIDDLDYLLEEIKKVEFDKPIWLKLSPYMSPCELAWFAEDHSHLDFTHTPTVSDWFIDELTETLIKHATTIQAVVMSNTIPNVSYGDALVVKSPDASTQHNRGGLSGTILRHHNLNLIDQLVMNGLTAHMNIVGCGGIFSGDDAAKYFEKDCVAVACTSGPSWYGSVKFFSNLLDGSEELLKFLNQ